MSKSHENISHHGSLREQIDTLAQVFVIFFVGAMGSIAIATAVTELLSVAPGRDFPPTRFFVVLLASYSFFRFVLYDSLVGEARVWGRSFVLAFVLASTGIIIPSIYVSSGWSSAVAPELSIAMASIAFAVSGVLLMRSLHHISVSYRTRYWTRFDAALVIVGLLGPILVAYFWRGSAAKLGVIGLPAGIVLGQAYLSHRRRGFLYRRSFAAPLIIPFRVGDRVQNPIEEETIESIPSPSVFSAIDGSSGLTLVWRPIEESPPTDKIERLRVAFRYALFKGDDRSARRHMVLLKRQLGESQENGLVSERAFVDFFEGRPEKVLAAYRREENPGGRLTALAACCYRLSGDYGIAINLIEDHLRSVPPVRGEPYLRATLADILFEWRKYSAAAEQIEKAALLEPSCPLITARHAYYTYRAAVISGKRVDIGVALLRVSRAAENYQRGLEQLGLYSLDLPENRSTAAVWNAVVFPTWSTTIFRMISGLLIERAYREVAQEDLPERIEEWLAPARRLITRCFALDPSDPVTLLTIAKLRRMDAILAARKGRKWSYRRAMSDVDRNIRAADRAVAGTYGVVSASERPALSDVISAERHDAEQMSLTA